MLLGNLKVVLEIWEWFTVCKLNVQMRMLFGELDGLHKYFFDVFRFCGNKMKISRNAGTSNIVNQMMIPIV